MANLSKITLPNNVTYDLADSVARESLNSKQDALVSGTNIKTINNQSILGSGDLSIGGGSTLITEQVTLLAASWISSGGVYTQNIVTINDPTNYTVVWVSPNGDPSNYVNGGIYCDSSSAFSLGFTAKYLPTNDIIVNVIMG